MMAYAEKTKSLTSKHDVNSGLVAFQNFTDHNITAFGIIKM